MIRTLIVSYLFVAQLSLGQNAVFVRNAQSEDPAVELKWYTQELINPNGIDIYRKTDHSTWARISSRPVVYRGHKPTRTEMEQDTELKKYLDMLQGGKELKDLVKLATILKSFQSIALSKYLGIYFIDTTVKTGISYTYKICKTGEEMPFVTTELITATEYKPIDPPRELKSATSKNKISLRWLPETSRYYGMNIYRSSAGDSKFTKLNSDPLIISGHADSTKQIGLPEWFFEDKNLNAGETYRYQLEALDFFGSPSMRTEPVTVYLKDLEPPLPPDSVWGIPAGKTINIHWKKQDPEKDLLGYNIYRTLKNDTDYLKLNRGPIASDAKLYVDAVPDFGSYMYAVSCVDKDGNEKTCNPIFVNAYDNEAPDVPGQVQIFADSGQITLTWKKNSAKDLKGYYVYRTVDSDNKNTYVKLTPTAHPHDTFIDPLPFNSKNRFYYKICAVDKSLNRSGYSEPVSIRLPDLVAPQPPFIQKIITNEKNYPVLEWFQNAEPDLSHYLVLRKKSADPSTEFTQINVKPISAAVARFTDRHAGPETYDYTMVAIDSSGNRSANSNVLTLKVKEPIKDVQCSLKFTGNYNPKKEKIELKWQPDKTGDLRGFVLFRLTADEKQMTPITGCVTTLAFFDHQVSKDTKYTYQIRAYHMNGNVFHSKTLTITTTQHE